MISKQLLAFVPFLIGPRSLAQESIVYTAGGDRASVTSQVRSTEPVVVHFAPRRAATGDLVNIYGRNFPAGDAGVSVTVDAVPATVESVSTRVITITVPAGITGTGAIQVSIGGEVLDAGDLTHASLTLEPSFVSGLSAFPTNLSVSLVGGTKMGTVSWEVEGIPNGNASVGTILSTGDTTALYTAPDISLQPDLPILITAISDELGLEGYALVTAECNDVGPILVPGDVVTVPTSGDAGRICLDLAATPGQPLIYSFAGPYGGLVLRDSQGFVEDFVVDATSGSIFDFFSAGSRLELETYTAAPPSSYAVGVLPVGDPSIDYWVQVAGGDWEDGAGWLKGIAPSPGADVLARLTGTGTVDVSSAVSVATLDAAETIQLLSGGELTVTDAALLSDLVAQSGSKFRGDPGAVVDLSGSLEMYGTSVLEGDVSLAAGALRWREGTMTGSGTLRVQGGLLEQGVTGNPRELRGGWTLENEGVLDWEGSLSSTYLSVHAGEGAVFRNLPGAVLDCKTTSTAYWDALGDVTGPSTIENEGAILRTAGTGTVRTRVGSVLNNVAPGNVDVQTGILSFVGGGTSTGSFQASAGAVVEYAGDHTISGDMTGAGLHRITKDSVILSGSPTLENVEVPANATLNIGEGSPVLAGELALVHRTGQVTGSGTLSGTGTLRWREGTMTGPGALRVQGGVFEQGTSGAPKELRGGWTLENEGNLEWEGSHGSNVTFYVGEGAVFRNLPGAVLDCKTTGTAYWDALGGVTGPSTIENEGAILRTAGTRTTRTRFGSVLNNTAPGTVHVQTGILDFEGGGMSTGSFQVSADGTLEFGGAHTISGNMTGAGIHRVTGGSVTLSGSPTLESVEVSNNGTLDIGAGTSLLTGELGLEHYTAELTGSGALSGTGTLRWREGTMTGAGTLRVQGGVLEQGGSGPPKELRGGWTLENEGTLEWEGAHGNHVYQSVYAGEGAVFRNLPGAVLDCMTTGPAYWDALDDVTGPSTIENEGIIRRTAGTGTTRTTVGSVLNNTAPGTIEVETGILDFEGGGTSTGPFQVSAGATIEFGGAHTISGDMTGAGVHRIADGSVTLGGNPALENVAVFTSAVLDIGTGSPDLTGELALEHYTGQLTGSGALSGTGTLRWREGTMTGAGTLRVQGGVLEQGGSGPPKELRGGWTLENEGTLDWEGTHGNHVYQSVYAGEGAVFRNLPGAVLDCMTTGPAYWQAGGDVTGSSSIENEGIIRRTAGTGTTRATFGVVLNNMAPGTVDVQTGILEFEGGGTSTGSFLVSADATLEFGGAHTISGDLTGAGIHRIAGGSVTLSGSPTLENVEVSTSGTLDIGPGSAALTGELGLDFTAELTGSGSLSGTGTLRWREGTMTGAGTLRVQGGVLEQGVFGSPKELRGGWTLENGGTLDWEGTHGNHVYQSVYAGEGAVFRNLPGAVLDCMTTGPAYWQAGDDVTGPSTIENEGTISSTSSAAKSFGSIVENSGTITIEAGTLNFDGGVTQTTGAYELNGGSSSGTLDLQGGTFRGTGTHTGNVTNGGDVEPGGDGQADTLTVTGDYTQTAGTLRFELGGTGAGTFDVLAVSGALALGSALEVELLGGFTPTVGDEFEILTGASVTGSFRSQSLPSRGNWEVDLTSGNSVVLRVVP